MAFSPEFDQIMKENSILKDRCYSLTHGNWCKVCDLPCHHHDDDNEGQCKYENLGYDK